ncbi:MAG TPA: hypothetical protein VF796_00860 [Humisphaera sp.]
MPLLYVLAALLFPAVFVLWRPLTRADARALRVRVAGATVVVWLLVILSVLRSPAVADSTRAPEDPPAEPTTHDAPGDSPHKWETESPPELAWALAVGWVPGLAYAGLLVFVRRLFEPPASAIEVSDLGGGPPFLGGR